jgi:shikimate dehydrogenase
MAPNIETAPPIPYEHITQNHLLYDVVYTPSETKFLNLGSQQGAVCKNGLEMLHLQAEASWEIWTKQ